MTIPDFQKIVWGYYCEHGRHELLWRQDVTPYKIIVSEIMLQQTQVSRVSQKFPEFLATFPDFESLSKASLVEVLTQWQGLGYSRRAKFLHQTAKTILADFDGKIPLDTQTLSTLPGIGENTAGAILAYSYNLPTVFIETNIRRIFIHHFFPNQDKVSDKDLLPIIADSLDKNNSREWYWALMDYGSHLKQKIPNPNKRSANYSVQSRFEGSNRQVRAMILKSLLERPKNILEIAEIFEETETRIHQNISDLIKEGFVELKDNYFSIV